MPGPSIPVYNRPMVQERGAPNVRVAMDAPAAAFGGGEQQALENVGKALDLASDSFAKAKQDADTTAAQEKVWALKRIKNNILTDPRSGALYTQGSNAFDVKDKALEAFNKEADALEAAAQNDDQRAMIRGARQTYLSQMEEDINKHVGKEIQAHEDNVFKTGVQTVQDEIATFYDDPAKIAFNLKELDGILLDKARRSGMDGGTTALLIKTEKSKALAAVVERHLDKGDDLKASEFYKANKDMFTGDDMSRAEKALQAGSILGEGRRQADAIMQTGVGMMGAIEKAREIEDTKVSDETVRRIKENFALKEAAKREQLERQSISITNLIEKSKSIDSIPRIVWANLPDSERTRYRNYASNLAQGKDLPENSKEYYNLKLMAGNPETRNRFLQTNLLDYVDKVKGTQLSELIKDQADARAGKGDATAKLDGFMSDLQIAEGALQQIGVKRDSEEGIAYLSALDRAVSAKAKAKGRKLENEEIRAEANNLAVQVVTDKGWLWNSRKRAYQLEPEDAVLEVEPSEIPRGEKAKIDAALQRAGKAVNDANRAALYSRMIGKQRGN